jgi:AraC-like DNA-binding protein
MSDRFKVSALLASRLRELKVPLPAVLARGGLPVNFFNQEKISVTTSELFALWRAIGETSGDLCIGLKLGAETRLERFDAVSIAAVCSRSFRDAVLRVAKYKELTCPEEIRINTNRDEAAVEFEFLKAEEPEPEVLVDLCLSWTLALGRRGTGERIKPLRLELNRPAKNREMLEEHFGCRAQFKAGRNAIIFRNIDLDRPFVTHNVDLLEVTGAQLESELRARNATLNVGEEVKHTLRRSLAGKRPILQSIARELGMSVRTLQRRLTDAGLSFQQLVEDTRRELARHYLKQSAVELNEAAYLLGYENANSFFRAFHSWEGMPPGEWRAQHATRTVVRNN